MSAEQSALSPKDVLPLFKGATVRMPRLVKGKPVVGKGGVYEVEDRPLGEADILAVREDGGLVRIVTADGRKLEAQKPEIKR